MSILGILFLIFTFVMVFGEFILDTAQYMADASAKRSAQKAVKRIEKEERARSNEQILVEDLRAGYKDGYDERIFRKGYKYAPPALSEDEIEQTKEEAEQAAWEECPSGMDPEIWKMTVKELDNLSATPERVTSKTRTNMPQKETQ